MFRSYACESCHLPSEAFHLRPRNTGRNTRHSYRCRINQILAGRESHLNAFAAAWSSRKWRLNEHTYPRVRSTVADRQGGEALLNGGNDTSSITKHTAQLRHQQQHISGLYRRIPPPFIQTNGRSDLDHRTPHKSLRSAIKGRLQYYVLPTCWIIVVGQ